MPAIEEHQMLDIKEFFKGRSVFITGGTGFMGKVLVEKLLRSCVEIKAVYVLLRPKPKMDQKQRFKALLQSKVFDRLKKERPEALDKLVVVSGDIRTDGLGLSKEDEELLITEVSVVVHMAATVRFDEDLRVAMDVNVDGTRRVLDLCCKMRHLSAVVHVSTAYCNCSSEVVEEVVCPLPYNRKDVSRALHWMDDDLISSLTAQLLRDHPNTYTFTKALAEQLVVEDYSHLPIAILRPSLVMSAWREPFPGWIDNFYGPTGYVLGYAKGIIRCLAFEKEKAADIIPVDIGINMIIAVAWYTATHNKPNNGLVYNCVSRLSSLLNWGTIHDLITEQVYKNPVNGVLWYPSITAWNSRLCCNLMCTLIYIFPLGFLDLLAKLTGRKPLLLRILRKCETIYWKMHFFISRQWKFTYANVDMLSEAMSSQDQEEFGFDFRDADMKEYVTSYFSGIKRYILKENPSELPAARSHLRKMYLLFILVRILGLALVWQLLVALLGSPFSLLHSIY